jgi:hypothetical protein
MCEICDANNRITAVPEEHLPQVIIGDNGEVVIKMGPEYQAAALDNEGQTYLILNPDLLMDLLVRSTSRRVGFNIGGLFNGLADIDSDDELRHRSTMMDMNDISNEMRNRSAEN